ncbi:MAG: hypothetical protein C0467_01985 [Planctomycetaceae bacterium]|nr:hypothetical protein [Planctomycetaceae bacterium]
MTDDEFLTAFEAAAISRSEWTHNAHVWMAWLYLTRLPHAKAGDRIRAGIQKLNSRNGVVDGYHETITTAFMRIISARLLHSETYEAFRARNPDLYDRTHSPVYQYYTKERLLSFDARVSFVEPDMQPLPTFELKSYFCRTNSEPLN